MPRRRLLVLQARRRLELPLLFVAMPRVLCPLFPSCTTRCRASRRRLLRLHSTVCLCLRLSSAHRRYRRRGGRQRGRLRGVCEARGHGVEDERADEILDLVSCGGNGRRYHALLVCHEDWRHGRQRGWLTPHVAPLDGVRFPHLPLFPVSSVAMSDWAGRLTHLSLSPSLPCTLLLLLARLLSHVRGRQHSKGPGAF